jgi:hypothetical protein
MLSARVVVCTHAKLASNPDQVAYQPGRGVAPLNSQRGYWENHAATRPMRRDNQDENPYCLTQKCSRG